MIFSLQTFSSKRLHFYCFKLPTLLQPLGKQYTKYWLLEVTAHSASMQKIGKGPTGKGRAHLGPGGIVGWGPRHR